jgi:hypothetical protein
MQSYNAKTGYIEVCFMTVNKKIFNVARALNQFVAASREHDYEFTILPLAGGWGKVVMGAIIGDLAGITQCWQKGQPQMTQQTFQH